jgi:hypothetical protein
LGQELVLGLVEHRTLAGILPQLPPRAKDEVAFADGQAAQAGSVRSLTA